MLCNVRRSVIVSFTHTYYGQSISEQRDGNRKFYRHGRGNRTVFRRRPETCTKSRTSRLSRFQTLVSRSKSVGIHDARVTVDDISRDAREEWRYCCCTSDNGVLRNRSQTPPKSFPRPRSRRSSRDYVIHIISLHGTRIARTRTSRNRSK